LEDRNSAATCPQQGTGLFGGRWPSCCNCVEAEHPYVPAVCAMVPSGVLDPGRGAGAQDPSSTNYLDGFSALRYVFGTRLRVSAILMNS
jgi:hypothetical protein